MTTYAIKNSIDEADYVVVRDGNDIKAYPIVAERFANIPSNIGRTEGRVDTIDNMMATGCSQYVPNLHKFAYFLDDGAHYVKVI